MRSEWLGGGIVIGVDGGEEGDGGRRGARWRRGKRDVLIEMVMRSRIVEDNGMMMVRRMDGWIEGDDEDDSVEGS